MTTKTPDNDEQPEVTVNDVDAQDDADVADDQAPMPYPATPDATDAHEADKADNADANEADSADADEADSADADEADAADANEADKADDK
jgi:hypothetical protein